MLTCFIESPLQLYLCTMAIDMPPVTTEVMCHAGITLLDSLTFIMLFVLSIAGTMASGGSMPTDQGQVFKLIKLEPLGVGAYGSVYVAKYGDTKCAAKIMHQVLFQFSQEGGKPSMLDRFEQECELLRTIRHPRIVQFLDKVIDPDTGLSVLLMELMGENLTHYLEKSSQPPDYHVQVNIFHDIASALSYLHSRGFIHRDVSSNNVLLVAGCCRAKLSDFGVSRSTFENMDEMTICPGSVVYMAPECSFRTGYSNKVDVFSLGVVGYRWSLASSPIQGLNMNMLIPCFLQCCVLFLKLNVD